MVKDSEVCPDVKKFVKANIADNEAFNIEGDDVIKRALQSIKEGLGKTDLEKSNDAWIEYICLNETEGW